MYNKNPKISFVNGKALFCGYEFKFVQKLNLEQKDGKLLEYNTGDKYKKSKYLPRNKYGYKNFCKFKIRKDDEFKVPSVYLWVEDDEVIYIGETVNLLNRFNTGYGIISPRNCFVGGQTTNCHLNSFVLEEYEKDKTIDIYYLPTSLHKEIEKDLLNKVHTKLNKKNNVNN